MDLQKTMETVANEVSLLHVSPSVSTTTLCDVVDRCCLSWNSTHGKYQRDKGYLNSDLSPRLNGIMAGQKSMVTIAQCLLKKYLLETECNTASRLNSMIRLEKQNKETTCRINSLIKAVPEWGPVPQATHDGLNVCALEL